VHFTRIHVHSGCTLCCCAEGAAFLQITCLFHFHGNAPLVLTTKQPCPPHPPPPPPLPPPSTTTTTAFPLRARYFMGGTNDDYCSVYARRQFPIVISLLVIVPLSMLRNIDSLKYTSAVAVIAIMYLLFVVVIKSGESIRDSE
jgi:hypothetical protein